MPAEYSEGAARTLHGATTPSRFIRLVADEARVRTAALEGTWTTSPRGVLLQVWRGDDRAQHYEVWLHPRVGKIELGAHFEGPADDNRRAYALLDAHLVEVQAALGPGMWLEDWDRGWVRMYETVPLLPLDEFRAPAIAERLLEIISVVQPLLDAADPRELSI